VPTVTEAGVPGFDATLWLAFVVPAGTPDAIIARFNREATAVLKDPEIRKRLEDIGLTPDPGTPEELDARIRSELKRWGDVAERAGIKVR
jgi:tripartite-type tricarboxylate transporter receptor subunit TctC